MKHHNNVTASPGGGGEKLNRCRDEIVWTEYNQFYYDLSKAQLPLHILGTIHARIVNDVALTCETAVMTSLIWFAGNC